MKCDKHTMLLYAVTDRAWVGDQTLYQQVESALKGGATCVQLREKHLDDADFLQEAIEIHGLCQQYGVPLFINDNVDVAVKCHAEGIHVGQSDMAAAKVRERVGERNSVRINSILTDIIAHSGDGELRMSPDMREAVDVFTTFMYEGVYYNPIAKGEERKVQNILGSIWEYYVNHIDELPVVYQSIADDEGPQRAVCDYVSGMTDSYALEVYSELFIPAAWTIK
jgi:dGTP triphosphohydrolase